MNFKHSFFISYMKSSIQTIVVSLFETINQFIFRPFLEPHFMDMIFQRIQEWKKSLLIFKVQKG